MSEIGYKWHPIEDYSEEERSWDAGLSGLAKVWKEQRAELDSKGLVDCFLGKLQRKWAIETGVLERIYTLDRGVTQLLIEKGIEATYISHESTDKNPEFVAQVIKDQYDVVNGIFDFVKSTRPLSTSYIKELHAALCRNQKTTQGVDNMGIVHDVPLLSGEYKMQPNSPTRTDGRIHEYCPPEQVASEMDRLIELYNQHEKSDSPTFPEVEAAWLHHRFVQIHPFQDGNGRVARTLASLVFIKAGWFPLTITRDDKNEYLDALEAADAGSLIPLIELFARVQRRTFTSALGLVGEIQNTTQVSSVIRDIRERLIEKQNKKASARENAKTIAEKMIDHAQEEMLRTADALKQQLRDIFPKFNPFVACAHDRDPKSHYYRNQIIDMARVYDYFANPTEYRAWCCLVLPGKSQSKILVSAHAMGREYRGVIAISACFFNINETEEHNRQIGDFSTLGKDFFQVNYEDNVDSVEKRFSTWLSTALATGLAMWNTNIEE